MFAVDVVVAVAVGTVDGAAVGDVVAAVVVAAFDG